MSRESYKTRSSKTAVGHYSALWMPDDRVGIPTTITSQRKSHARELEAAKRNKLIAEMELTSGPIPRYAKSYDSINRRWLGIKGTAIDG